MKYTNFLECGDTVRKPHSRCSFKTCQVPAPEARDARYFQSAFPKCCNRCQFRASMNTIRFYHRPFKTGRHNYLVAHGIGPLSSVGLTPFTVMCHLWPGGAQHSLSSELFRSLGEIRMRSAFHRKFHRFQNIFFHSMPIAFIVFKHPA